MKVPSSSADASGAGLVLARARACYSVLGAREVPARLAPAGLQNLRAVQRTAIYIYMNRQTSLASAAGASARKTNARQSGANLVPVKRVWC